MKKTASQIYTCDPTILDSIFNTTQGARNKNVAMTFWNFLFWADNTSQWSPFLKLGIVKEYCKYIALMN
jgi:hypothetical protein